MAWQAEVAGTISPERLIFLDESGIDTRLSRAYARAPRGCRARGHVPAGHWRRVTILGGLAQEGLVAAMTVTAATSTAVFLAFLDQVLIPALRRRPGALVVMDNLAPHKAAVVRDTLGQAGLAHRYLPAYSPDLNPIELCWSKMKTLLRARQARSLDALDRELPGVLAQITAKDANAWFRHCGYRSN